ncbi:MAG: bifunctional demethylmenaquinone methyltransferase/2-methoxy-6-polyprenyl-1,4-benzoquinol methylase UbiE [Flavobacteriales bacterium]|jgi:demethylmenaquinone methyltransferase/2-methoxy-6-polyprenyl-1,4-benzoquinol methylase|nr:bifunctional demethylmenaquinone methyltransferase/2-methoxy-6-polyprenyl-1,4-benzoquinol methylase UbiE [Flavobacteriales bacterium]MBK7620008.1 bifunctional demethylmenaquinone methyltransferase/2-methoxy-6-polyprenyl-1,4-benzoquinol methylase UbiE [Flavobacteriales bacterium]MBK8531858.1 bifunctional demethylmenaquinone methyltransferase/2-methoxy-6-polyprenyl-1,4-benzoquinol methylase UbiE [Flavobacteriales bacterium]MCC6910831.1 bifunctional demethylmenaquinone methyltransferase/2-methox
MTVTPYSSDGSKREQVEQMFDAISPKYDLLNRLFSMGIDQRWRRLVIRSVGEEPTDRLLDVATGTADLAILAAKTVKEVIGIDISEGMLSHGRTKVKDRGLEDRITLQQADSIALPFDDARFDAVTVAFGVRNFEDLERGLSEMFRVLRPGGRLFVLEFSKPQRTPMRQLFRFYFHRVMPLIGRSVSKDSAAYTYLPQSVDAFPEGPAFKALLRAAGGREVRARGLTGGIATLYSARK